METKLLLQCSQDKKAKLHKRLSRLRTLNKTPERGRLLTFGMNLRETNDEIIEKISNFVESARLDDDKRRKEARQDEVPSTSELDERQQNNQHNQPHMDFAKSLATKILLEAEKSRGDVNQQPAGMLNVVDSTVNAFQPKQFISVFRPTDGVIDDDEFFHVTCHVD